MRLIGVDTPETVKRNTPVACFGPVASSYAKQLLTGLHVRIAYEPGGRTDRYGRQLWDVWLPDGRFVAGLLVADGLGRAYPFPPQTRYAALLARIQSQAKAGRRGLWGSPCNGRSFSTLGPGITVTAVRSEAAGDAQHRAGDVARLGAEQPCDRWGDLVRLADTSHGHPAHDPVESSGIACCCVDSRTDQPRRNGVDPYSIIGQLLGQADSQRVDRSLGSGVVHVLMSSTKGCGGRRHGDDGAADTAALCRHALRSAADAENDAQEVDVDDADG